MQNKKIQISAIVPVYNEEKRVARVITTLLKSKLISEIICINDGSSDKSLEILQKFGSKIILINFKSNKGKGTAVAEGIRKAKGDYLFFCDSDLINFTTEHIGSMLEPILDGKTKAVLAVPALDETGRYARHEIFLAGERIYPRKDLLPHVSKLTRTKGAGGSEIVLNSLFRKKEVFTVPLIGLKKPFKGSKWSSSLALRQGMLSVIGVLQESGRIEINSIGDLKKLENLIQVTTFEDLIEKIKKLRNKKLRMILEKYYTKYIFKYTKRLRTKNIT
ncbi:MAG: glycosyltransferase family 2 protein [Patescibacteria group bacterium]